jgi:hypothetical protein
MSWKATAYVKELGKGCVNRSEKLLLFVLADYHRTDMDSAWPSVKTLAADALMSDRTVQRCLAKLEAKGIICIGRGTGRGATNTYNFPQLKGATTTPFSNEKGDILEEKGCHFDAERVTFQKRSKHVKSSAVKGLREIRQIQPKEPSIEPIREQRKENSKKEDPEIDVTQYILPWMRKQWDNHPRRRGWKRWIDPRWPEQLERLEASAGKEVVRKLWIDFLDTEEQPNAVKFIQRYYRELSVPDSSRSEQKVSTSPELDVWREQKGSGDPELDVWR